MCSRTVISFAISVFFIVSSVNEVSAIKCWRCWSDVSGSAFCNDPFNASAISEQQKRWSYVECTNPPGQINPYAQGADQKAVCKKLVQFINDKIVVSRGCFWENVNGPKNDCVGHKPPSYIETISCETCSTDGCNGEAMNPVVENGNSTDDIINTNEEREQ